MKGNLGNETAGSDSSKISTNTCSDENVPSSKSLIFTSSVGGLYGEALLAPYVASKFAVRGLSLALAQELGPMGIRVNAVFPGPTDTSMFAKRLKQRRNEQRLYLKMR